MEILDSGTSVGNSYLAFHLLDISLEDALRNADFHSGLRKCLRDIFLQLAEAVDCMVCKHFNPHCPICDDVLSSDLHILSIVHTDIKPANILLDQHNRSRNPMGEPILTDFGLATGALNPQRIESMKVKVLVFVPVG